MKRSLKWIAFFVIMLSLTTFFALSAGAETEGYYIYTVENGEATITDVDAAISGDIVIPDTFGGYPVTSIGANAFEDCASITSIDMPDTVTSIEQYAFRRCTGLISIDIPSSVTSIGNYAFYNCSSLTSIEIPSSVTSIGTYAFWYCTAFTEINFNATAMNDLAYNNYVFTNAGKSGSGITVNIGANVTKIPACLFYPSASLTFLPNITSVVFAENSQCESIGYAAFNICSSLTSVEIPNSVTSIGDFAFSSCSSLTSVEIPNSVTSIGDSAFSSCSSLTSIEIPSGVTGIGYRAFSSCSSLTSIELPSSVTSIGDYVFRNCYNLADVYYSGSEEEWNAITKGGNWDDYAGRDTAKGTYTLHHNYEKVDVCAYQVTKAENGLFSLRAIAGMNSLAYESFGYEVTITTKDEGGNDVVQTLSGSDDKVYSSVYGGGAQHSIKDEFGYEYGGLATIADLDIDSNYTKIKIRAYVTTVKGEVKYGKLATILYTGMLDLQGYPQFTSVTE